MLKNILKEIVPEGIAPAVELILSQHFDVSTKVHSITKEQRRIIVATEAVNYRDAEGHIQQAASLSIIDNGTGFSSKILSRAFEPYATSKPRGTGLGLAVVKKIIEEHGGRIDIKNRTDVNGAKVAILLLKLALTSNI